MLVPLLTYYSVFLIFAVGFPRVPHNLGSACLGFCPSLLLQVTLT